MVFNTPSNFLFGLFNLSFVSFIENLEEVWIDLKVIFSDLKMI